MWGLRQYSIFFSILLVPLVLLISINADVVFGVKVSGRVLDSATGKPVADAWVYGASGHSEICPFEGGGCSCITHTSQLTKTDSQGYYQFEKRFFFGSFLASKFGMVQAYKPGFITSPEMILERWHNETKQSSLEAASRYIDPIYFKRTGSHQKNYKVVVPSTGSTYFLSSRSVEQIARGPGTRLDYIYSVSDTFGANCKMDISASQFFFPVLKSMYDEAVPLVKNSEDEKLLRIICHNVRGTMPLASQPCDIRDGPAH